MAVLITRPDERGKQLTDWLNQSGIVALHLPLFCIESGRELGNLPSALNQLKNQDYVFLVSQNAVDFCHKTLADIGFCWPESLHYFTVGHRTAQYFSSQSERPIHYPITTENSEGVLALPNMQNLQDKRILILRGNGGRDFFAEQARIRGAEVILLETYQRVPIIYNNEEQTSICKRSGINTIIATNLEIVNALVNFVPKQDQGWLKSCRLITVSQRIADVAHKLGWHNITVSPKADNQSLLNTLLETN
ncbi:uroporphyrinogen-III synthase [Rodentibacter caecimuris]|uniref:Uroporphyrinogen-III synthase n=1 Tax=Rodentibacter caecimuris TaxID=1796644 RepID=A0ABX3KY85_9PAST|nr:uroporphyrinogen-III synthase [Rodentibacter heylii]